MVASSAEAAVNTMATKTAKGQSMLWGSPLEFWDLWGVRLLFIGAVVGVGGLALSALSAYVLYRVADVAQKDLVAETSRAATELTAAQADIEKSRAEIAQANEGAAKANESALKLQLLLNDEIRKNAWRRLSKEQHDVIAEAVSRALPLKVSMGFDGNDPEASMYASDLIKAFEDGGATVHPQPSAMFIGQLPVSGMIFAETQGFDSSAVQAAFTSANIPFTPNPSFRGETWASISLYVGHKPQAF
jgi:hypothetical protein